MKLKTLLAPIVCAALSASAFAGSPGKACVACQPPAEPNGLFDTVGATATIGYDTNYIFRGVQFAKNLVSGSLDLVVPIQKDKISLDLNAWYGASADDSAAAFAGGGSYGELDLSAALNVKLDPVTVGLKYTYYNYTSGADAFIKDVNELGLTLGTSLAGFDLGAGGYYDFTAKGWYFEYTISRTIKINDWLSLVPGFLISHGHDYYGVNGGNHIKLGLAAPIRLTKTATLTPYIAGNLPIDSLKDNGEKNRVYGGVSLSVSF